MIAYIQSFLKKHVDIILYIVFGVITTVANYVVYIPLYNYLHISAVISNAIAWIAAVLIAFLTNKSFVFKSYDWSAKVVFPELIKFIGCRIGSGVTETVILFVAVDFLGGNGNVWKLVTSVVVVILNYIASKLIVFRK